MLQVVQPRKALLSTVRTYSCTRICDCVATSGSARRCADVAESGLASLGPGAGRAGPESQALALLASLVRHTERARTHWPARGEPPVGACCTVVQLASVLSSSISRGAPPGTTRTGCGRRTSSHRSPRASALCSVMLWSHARSFLNLRS